ncbi:MAG: ATP-dependent Clp protease ATP-binding subunit ClpX [Lachnospiraceae bacterium]|nr:ATP-dependent Clp protease ATP-binding subunit ClpX [Lachnospiraceae bacterium]
MSDEEKNGGGTEEFCSICRRSEKNAGQLFKLPNDINICQDCMRSALEHLNNFDLSSFMPLNGFQFGFPMPDINKGNGKEEAVNDAGQDVKGGDSAKTSDADSKEDSASAEPDAKDTNTASGSGDDSKKDEKKDDKKDDKGGKGGFNFGMPGGFPNIQFLNLQDFMGGVPGKKKVKKSSKEDLKKDFDFSKLPRPHKIKEMLDKYVVGQEYAKKVVSVAVYNHYKRIEAELSGKNDVEIEKSNILLLGPTGCGKTYLVKTLAKLLDVPLAIADATSLTEAGYIGDDIESVVSKLLAAADNDVNRAERGIIFIDEIDKIAKKKNTTSRDVSGESVQQGMLKLLEGSEIEVPVGANSKNMMVPLATVNTKDILFICGGAFPDLDEIIRQRLRKETSIGFNAELKDRWDKEKNILKKVRVEDIKKFGMIPEFIGRLPIICPMEGLTEDMMVQILKEPKNAIMKQYVRMLEMDEVKLEFTDEALHAVAKKAMERDTGARALRSVIEDFMLDIMYEVPKDDNIGTVRITKEYIEGTGGPVIELRGIDVPRIEEKPAPEEALV